MKKVIRKIFVLDTNVLLDDPGAILSFDDNIVVLPITVIEELDGKKDRGDEIGRNARESSRILDGLRAKGSLCAEAGVKTEKGGLIRVDLNNKEILGSSPPGIDFSVPDNRILSVAYNLSQKEKEKEKKDRREVWIITKDINMRLKADAMGLLTEDRTSGKVSIDSLYSGWREIVVPPGVVDKFYKEKILSLKGKFFPNEFVHLIDEANPKQTCIARFISKEKGFVKLNRDYDTAYDITYANMQQRMALEILLDPQIELVTLVGQAGTGKTLLALAAGLEGVVALKHYNKMSVSRPIMPMGKDLGYMPGDVDEKLAHWMGPIYDNLEFLISKDSKGVKKIKNGARDDFEDVKSLSDKIGHWFKTGVISLEALTYIRGRSIPNQFVIVDEAQNLTPHEIKTIISRAGEGTKIILTGDPAQIDNPYLDSESNGLTYAVERLKNRATIGHITLLETERSGLASIAAEDL